MSYWGIRAANSLSRLTTKSINDTEKQLRKYYGSSMEKILGQFEATYNKLLSTMEEGKEPTPADLYRLDRYWQLQNQLREELQKLGDEQYVLLSKVFMAQFQAVYEGVALPSADTFSTLDTAVVQQMINEIWVADGKSWSQRIWENTELLKETLNDGLIHCVAAGKKPTELKTILQERFNTSYGRADALVRTEMAHIQTQAAKKRYTDYGIQEVEILADKDERRCDECGKLHKKRYPVGAAVPIPAHPNCRCAIVPVID